MSGAPYPIPAVVHRTELVVDRSRFIATLAPCPTLEAARAFLESMRGEFVSATHNCWAYVVGPPGSTAVVGMSDAGEPHGTAGRPMLDVLLHSGVGDIAAVVTRFYGGTKLGKGGLVRAYGGAVQQALATLPTALHVDRVALRITVPYGDVEALRRVLAEYDGVMVEEQYGEVVDYVVAVPAAVEVDVTRAVADRTAGRGVVAAVTTPP